MRSSWRVGVWALAFGVGCALGAGVKAEEKAGGAGEKVKIRLKAGGEKEAKLKEMTERGVSIEVDGVGTELAWDKIEPASAIAVKMRLLDPKDADAWLALGNAAAELKLAGPARECYEKAVALKPALAAETRAKLESLRGAALETPIKAKFQKRPLAEALKSLEKAGGVTIRIDSKLAKDLQGKKLVSDLEANGQSLANCIEWVIGPHKLQHLVTPEGIVVYSRELGLGEETAKPFLEATAAGSASARLSAMIRALELGIGAAGERVR